ncbi:hypothetical protein Hypma_014492 [Hypsizygus marmoreus]|uniref:Uncharacterized protein n=1 Tax=Hypsizygus marmoreus TaxID=39966 RepID=A0A369JDY3_HYPMA|nr:hypothetical protein Hypma_014492 [Hypsizygus marmoreus]
MHYNLNDPEAPSLRSSCSIWKSEDGIRRWKSYALSIAEAASASSSWIFAIEAGAPMELVNPRWLPYKMIISACLDGSSVKERESRMPLRCFGFYAGTSVGARRRSVTTRLLIMTSVTGVDTAFNVRFLLQLGNFNFSLGSERRLVEGLTAHEADKAIEQRMGLGMLLRIHLVLQEKRRPKIT